jgi:hypothetical protein
MNQVRLSAQNEKCRFGRSKESKILIGIIAVGGFTLLVIGLMIGHCSIIAYRKLVVKFIPTFISYFTMIYSLLDDTKPRRA